MNVAEFIIPKEIAVKRFASDYSAEELAKIKDSFKPVAEINRRHQKISDAIVLTMVFALLVSIAIAKYFPTFSISSSSAGLVYIGLIVGLFFLLLAYRTPSFKCPACQNELYYAKTFCPECGGQLVAVSRSIRDEFHCEKCSKHILSRKGKRYFKFKFCTYCAVKLDDQGV
jgi:hypothetical protein